MATAGPPNVASTTETTNYARLCRLLVDVGAKALRDTFDTIHLPSTLPKVLKGHHHATLTSLKKKRVLNPTQWRHLFPAMPSSVSSDQFDITLLMVLLRNICSLTPPSSGWDALPPSAEMSREADIARIKYYRNTVYGHAAEASVDSATFQHLWKEIRETLVRLGGPGYGSAVDNLETQCMDPDIELHYRELLKQWKNDEDNIKDKVDEVREKLVKVDEEVKATVQQLGIGLNTKLDELKASVNEATKTRSLSEGDDEDKIKDKIDEVSKMLAKVEQMGIGLNTKLDELKASVNEATERRSLSEDSFDPSKLIDRIHQLYRTREGMLSPFPWREDFTFNLDDIYTRLQMVGKEKTRRSVTQPITNITSIFQPHQGCPKPRTVLIEGAPGMGKSTYCQKLAYDWATKKQVTDESFPDIEVLLLLKCRDIGTKFNIWDAIDDQILPRDVKEDEKQRFFEFIRANQSKVLLVLDGLDEASPSTFSMLYDLIQSRELPDCYIVITSRQEVGMKVRKYCDSLLEIVGFSEEDAMHFIKKYFKNLDDLAERLLVELRLDHRLAVMTVNPLSTGLLCLLCEDFKGALPKSRTCLYLELVRCLLTRFRKRKGLPDINKDLIEVYQGQLRELGLVALTSLRNNKLYFDECEIKDHGNDIAEFGFLSVQDGSSKRRPTRCYSFPHKTFQEFFAAFYLFCSLNDEEMDVESLVSDKSYLGEMQQVLLFTCGLLALKSQDKVTHLIKHLSRQITENGRKYQLVTLGLQCIEECRTETCDISMQLARTFGSELKLESFLLWPFVVVPLPTAINLLLCEAIKVNTTLTVLDLTYKHIGSSPAAVESLSEAIKVNTTLTELNLSHNHIGSSPAAVESLSEAIKVNTTLTKLYLGSNGIGSSPAAVESLSDAIKVNTTLTVLDLSVNNIGSSPAAVESLSEAIKVNSHLFCYFD